MLEHLKPAISGHFCLKSDLNDYWISQIVVCLSACPLHFIVFAGEWYDNDLNEIRAQVRGDIYIYHIVIYY